jgi:hypothetical protein
MRKSYGNAIGNNGSLLAYSFFCSILFFSDLLPPGKAVIESIRRRVIHRRHWTTHSRRQEGVSRPFQGRKAELF